MGTCSAVSTTTNVYIENILLSLTIQGETGRDLK